MYIIEQHDPERCVFLGIVKPLRDYVAHSFISLEQFFALSISITEMVYDEHKQNVVIGSLSAANIYIRENGQAARLSNNPEDNEAYCSPEQASRMNRMPDERSDLYSLGVVLYELLTGQLPLQPEAVETWESAHIYRMPTPITEIRSDTQGLLEAIVMKLLAKASEDRYQSAYGLLDDLRQCERMGQAGPRQSFEVGRRDRMRSLNLADAWLGHSAELEQLTIGLEQANQGKQAFRWVIGAEGIGKTTLVHRLQWKVVRSGGWFIEGRGVVRRKQDVSALQFMYTYEPVLQAIRQWIEQLWSEPVKVVDLLKEKLQAAYGQDEALAIASILPEAGPLLGVTSKNGATGKNNISVLLANLIRCLAVTKSPLVLFIDCLERADKGTHEVLRSLTMGDVTSGLLLIGACRIETAQGNEPLFDDAFDFDWLSDRWHGNPLEQVLLLPLGYEELRQVVADAMLEPTARLSLLSQAIYERTAGNPRMIRSLLEIWIQAKQLAYDDKCHRWVWDQELTGHINGSELHLELIEESYAKLSTETLELLVTAAVTGLTFHPSFLAQVSGLKLEQVMFMLQKAEEQGIVFAEGEIQSGDTVEISYSFQNNYVHQAVYAAGGENNTHRHRQVGLLQQRHWAENLDAIDHLNMAAEVMNGQEVRQLAESNLRAGRQALMDGRVSKAKKYVEAGLKLAKQQAAPEAEADSLYVQLKLALVWVEYMCGNMEQARKLLYDLKEQGGKLDKAERIQIWRALIQFHTTTENEVAVQYVKEALAEYDWKLSERPSRFSIMKEVTHTRLMLYQYRNKIEHLPINRDEEYEALCGLMEQAFFPLMVSNAGTLIERYAQFIRYGLRIGMNEALANMIGSYEQMVHRVIPNFTPVIPFKSLASFQRLDGIRPSFAHQIEFVGALSKQLENPMEASAYVVKAIRRGLELNEIDFANLAMITFLVSFNGDLQTLSHVLDFFDSHMKNKSGDTVLQMVEETRSYVKALQDESELRRFIAIPEPDGHPLAIAGENNYICGCKLEAAFLSGHYREALYWAQRGRETEMEEDWIRIRKQRIFEMLTLVALYPERNAGEQKQVCKNLRAQLGRMKHWKGFLGYNSAAYLLLSAEWKRLTTTPMDALREYMAAIKQARVEKYGLMEGISCERLALCYRHDLVSRSGAMIAMMDASTAYSHWGILLKVTQIREQHAGLMRPMSRLYEDFIVEGKPANEHALLQLPRLEIAEETQTAAGGGKEVRKAESVWQIVDAIGKVAKQNWQMSLLDAALQQSGAERALLLRYTQDSFIIEAKLDMTAHQETVPSSSSRYAESVLRHAAVTNHAVVLEDALQSYFLKDSYIQAHRIRSILSMPFAIPGDPSGVLLYLENSKIPGLFTEQDTKVLELIATSIIYCMLLEDRDGAFKSMQAARSEGVTMAGGVTREAADEAAAAVDLHTLVDPLTRRELEILMALAEGMSNREIAERYGIVETTVKTHTSRIFSKLGVKRRGQAVAKAKTMQLFD